jgi:hypothetical protein
MTIDEVYVANRADLPLDWSLTIFWYWQKNLIRGYITLAQRAGEKTWKCESESSVTLADRGANGWNIGQFQPHIVHGAGSI